MGYLTMGLFIVLISSCISLAAPNDDLESRLLFKESFDYSSADELRNKWIPWEGKEPLSLYDDPEGSGKLAVNPATKPACGIYILDSPIMEGIVEIDFYDQFGADEKSFVQAGLYVPSMKKILLGGINSTGWGINPNFSHSEAEDRYVFRDQPIGEPDWRVSSLERTPGWHTLKFVVEDWLTTIYIDDVELYRTGSVTTIEGIFLGSLWSDSRTDGQYREVRIREL